MDLFHHHKHGLLKRGEEGQSLVEMSLGLILLTIILSGLLDLGRVWYILTLLEDSAGEVALFMSINPNCETSVQCADPDNGDWRGRNASGDLVDLSNTSISNILFSYVDYTSGDSNGDGNAVNDPGDEVRVTIEYEYTFVTPYVEAIAGSNTVTLSVFASQTITGE